MEQETRPRDAGFWGTRGSGAGTDRPPRAIEILDGNVLLFPILEASQRSAMGKEEAAVA
jgi:hypothetical protein